MTTREEVELYMMGEFDGDKTALEAAIAGDPALAVIAREEAGLEMLLRDAAGAAVFCVGCGDFVDAERCNACGAAVRPGGYIVERVLVQNAHGRMYIARDADGKQVALKELAFVQSPTLAVIAMFEREAKFLRALEHPAIPRFVASFEEGTGVHARYYLAQELVTGESLEKRLENHFYTEPEILDLARQILEVLVYLQTVSPMVIHRDIKPANLIAKPDGKIAVVDFGAAHVQGTTAGSTSIGTFGYMPIEQLAGQVDATTDVYALGASLLHLLSRREPWRILQGVSLEGINVSPPLRDFLSKLVATEPTQRFANANEAVQALERITRGERLVRETHRPQPRRWLRPLLMAAAAFGLVAAGFGVHSLTEDSPTPTTIVTVGPPVVGTLRFDLTGGMQLFVDGSSMGMVGNGSEIPISAGSHTIVLVAGKERCQQVVPVLGDRTTTVTCETTPARRSPGASISPKETIPAGKLIDVEFKALSLHDVLRVVSDACGLGFVMPDNIDSKVTINLKQAPCDQVIEVILESHGLWYRYIKAGNLIRVAPRSALDRESEDTRARTNNGAVDDPMPSGPPVDFDFKDAPLHDLMRVLSVMAKVNLIVPSTIDARVTVRVMKAPWDVVLRTILDAHGLWYRYRPNGKLLRIAPRSELDREADAARARDK